MKLVSFLEPATSDLTWVNPETVCYMRKAIDGEGGKTMIVTMGGAFFVRADIEAVVDSFRRCEEE